MLRSRRRKKKRRRGKSRLFALEVCVVGVPRSWRRESLWVNLSWLKRSNTLKLTWWRGMMLRFRESQLNLALLQLKREGQRCNSLGLPVY